jgi:hypothetical protein
MSLSHLTIVPATREQQRQATANCYPQWGAPRGVATLEDYERIDDELNSPENLWSQPGRFTSWVLVPRADPGTTDILAACETYRRVALVQRPCGRVEEVATYGIASVFTPANQRRKGYAKHMLRLLHYVLSPREHMPPFPAKWGVPPPAFFGDAAFSVLYSDVGPDFYATCTKGETEPGWVAVRRPHRIFKVPSPGPGPSPLPPDTRVLNLEDAGELEAPTTDTLRQEMEALPGIDRPRAAILPQAGWFRQYPTRLEIFARSIGKDGSRHLQRCGMRFGSGKDCPFILYTVEPKEKDSNVLRLLVAHIQKPVSFEQLVAAAHAEGAEEIEVWGSGGEYDEHEHTLNGEDHIPALAQYGMGGDDVEWLWNEHCFWC